LKTTTTTTTTKMRYVNKLELRRLYMLTQGAEFISKEAMVQPDKRMISGGEWHVLSSGIQESTGVQGVYCIDDPDLPTFYQVYTDGQVRKGLYLETYENDQEGRMGSKGKTIRIPVINREPYGEKASVLNTAPEGETPKYVLSCEKNLEGK